MQWLTNATNSYNDHNGMRDIYGLPNGGPLNQYCGRVITQQDRCITFPNMMQHKVAPFKLDDENKPGQRKILVFFLVDPNVKITSTLQVPPQQQSWFVEQVKIADLPAEIVAYIIEFLEFPWALGVANNFREQLMRERKYFIDRNTEEYFLREFSLCEH
jgi:hypothetical protein